MSSSLHIHYSCIVALFLALPAASAYQLFGENGFLEGYGLGFVCLIFLVGVAALVATFSGKSLKDDVSMEPCSVPLHLCGNINLLTDIHEAAVGICDGDRYNHFHHLEAIILKSTEAIKSLIGTEIVRFLILDQDEARDMGADSGKGLTAESFRKLCGSVSQSSKIFSTEKFNRFDFPYLSDDETKDVHNIMLIPLLAKGRHLGVLMLGNTKYSKFYACKFCLQLVDSIAKNISIAISRSMDLDAANIKSRRSSALLSMLSYQAEDKPIEKILTLTVDTVNQMLEPVMLSIFICDHVRNENCLWYSTDGMEGLTLSMDQGLVGHVARTSTSVRIFNAYEDDRFCRLVDDYTGFTTKSILCVPVQGFSQTRPIAVVQVINKVNGDSFTRSEEDALLAVCCELHGMLQDKTIEMVQLRYGNRAKTKEEELASALESSILKEYGAAVPNRYVFSAQGIQNSLATISASESERRDQQMKRGARGLDTASVMGLKLESRVNLASEASGGSQSGVHAMGGLQEVDEEYDTGDDDDLADETVIATEGDLMRGGDDIWMSRGDDGEPDDGEPASGSQSDPRSTSATEPSRMATAASFKDKKAAKKPKIEPAVVNHHDVDPFHYGDAELLEMAFNMFSNFGLIQRFSIPEKALRAFLKSAGRTYHPENPFHNFFHAFGTMHLSYTIMRKGAAEYLTSLDILAVLLAAICHDVDHPGHSNQFEVAAGTDRAQLYADDAVLERHHTRVTLQLLASSDAATMLFELSDEERKELRAQIIHAIMGTDMSRHFDCVKEIHARGAAEGVGFYDRFDLKSRRALVHHIVHSADIGAQTQSAKIADKWTNSLVQEFSAQAVKETKLGLPVSAFMLGLDKISTRMQLQVGFIENIVLPLWSALSSCFPRLDYAVDELKRNQQRYALALESAGGPAPKPHEEAKAPLIRQASSRAIIDVLLRSNAVTGTADT